MGSLQRQVAFLFFKKEAEYCKVLKENLPSSRDILSVISWQEVPGMSASDCSQIARINHAGQGKKLLCTVCAIGFLNGHSV